MQKNHDRPKNVFQTDDGTWFEQRTSTLHPDEITYEVLYNVNPHFSYSAAMSEIAVTPTDDATTSDGGFHTASCSRCGEPATTRDRVADVCVECLADRYEEQEMDRISRDAARDAEQHVYETLHQWERRTQLTDDPEYAKRMLDNAPNLFASYDQYRDHMRASAVCEPHEELYREAREQRAREVLNSRTRPTAPFIFWSPAAARPDAPQPGPVRRYRERA